MHSKGCILFVYKLQVFESGSVCMCVARVRVRVHAFLVFFRFYNSIKFNYTEFDFTIFLRIG